MVLLEKLIVTQLIKKSLASYGTRRFIAFFKRARSLDHILCRINLVDIIRYCFFKIYFI
jgi:hypothetical protein